MPTTKRDRVIRIHNLLGKGSFQLFQPAPECATLTTRAAENEPHSHPTALHVAVVKPSDPAYQIHVSQVVPVGVATGARLRLHFWARSSTGHPLHAVVEKTSAPWTVVAQILSTLNGAWQEFHTTVTTLRAFAAQELAVRFIVGQQTGHLELAGITLENLGMDAKFRAAKPALKASAIQSRIEKYRMGALTVKVVDAKGKPVAGARVKVEQTRHAFLFGCNIFGLQPDDPHALQTAYQEKFAALFNYATLPFYWGGFEPQAGKPQFARLDAMARWCQAQAITTKGHPLIWHEVYPDWAPKTPKATVPLLRRRVFEIIAHYQDEIQFWDVFNEANCAAAWATKTGVGAWVKRDGAARVVETALGWARKAVQKVKGHATLLYNDFDIREPNLALLTELKQRHALPDAIGIQSHMHDFVWPLAGLWATVENFAVFGKPIHFTEVTVPSGLRPAAKPDQPPADWPTTPAGERAQAEYVANFYTLLFSHPAVQAITWWDFSDWDAWQKAPAGLVRKDMTPKPAYDRLMALIHQAWWTRASGKTTAAGSYTTRAFYGEHQITITDSRGQTATLSVSLPMSCGEKTVTATLL